MIYELVVIYAFGRHNIGDVISDQTLVASILADPYRRRQIVRRNPLSGAPVNNYSLAAGSGTFALTGRGAIMAPAEPLVSGTFALTGNAANLQGPLSPQVTQFFDRIVQLPDSARQGLYGDLIDGLVAAGVWAKLDALYVFAAPGLGDASLVNLKSPSYHALVNNAGGGPVIFTTDRGFSNCGAPTLSDVDTTFTPSTSTGNFQQNDAMVCVWQLGAGPEDKAFITTQDFSDHVAIYPKGTNGQAIWTINAGGNVQRPVNSGDGSGFWLMQRTGASASEIHINNTLLDSSTLASAALSTAHICIAPHIPTAAVAGIGASLTSGQQTALYSGLSTYLSAIGAI